MKKIHILVLKSYIGPLILTFFIVIFILLMQFLWKYIDDLVGKGLDGGIIAELLLYTSASFVPMSLPLAILIASIMTFGNMGENNELLALKSSGVSLQRIMSPLIILTIVLSMAAFFFANNVLPVIHLHASTLLRDIRKQRPELSIKAGEFYNGIEGYSIKINNKNPETNLLKGIKIYNHSDKKGNNRITIADSGYMKISDDESKLILTLYHGKNYWEIEEDKKVKPKRFPHEKQYFEEENIVIFLEGFGLNRTDQTLYASGSQMMTTRQLSVAQDSIKRELKKQEKRTSTLISKNIERNIDYMHNKSGKTQKNIFTANPYELFEELEADKKIEAYEKAISGSRSSLQNITRYDMPYESISVNLRRYKIEWHTKVTLAFACFVFFFIGAPLGAIIRKGGLGAPIVVSVIFFLIYYMLSLTGKKLVREDILDAFTGMWGASIILFIVGVFLTYKATSDSVILNTETYVHFFKQIFKSKKRSQNENLANKQQNSIPA